MLLIAVLAAGLLSVRPAVVPRSAFRRDRTVDLAAEVDFAAAVATSARSGSSVRMALVDAMATLPGPPEVTLVRQLRAGMPLDRLAAAFALALPSTGRFVAAAVTLAARDGGAVAPLFDRIAEQARRRVALERHHRAAVAQSRFSALVVGGLPLVVSVALFAGGRFRTVLAAGDLAVAALLTGVGLELTGLVTIGALIRRVR